MRKRIRWVRLLPALLLAVLLPYFTVNLWTSRSVGCLLTTV